MREGKELEFKQFLVFFCSKLDMLQTTNQTKQQGHTYFRRFQLAPNLFLGFTFRLYFGFCIFSRRVGFSSLPLPFLLCFATDFCFSSSLLWLAKLVCLLDITLQRIALKVNRFYCLL